MTLLTGKDIHELMLKNKDWIIITDKIKDFSLLEMEIPVKNRIIVEVFNKFDYAVCLENVRHTSCYTSFLQRIQAKAR